MTTSTVPDVVIPLLDMVTPIIKPIFIEDGAILYRKFLSDRHFTTKYQQLTSISRITFLYNRNLSCINYFQKIYGHMVGNRSEVEVYTTFDIWQINRRYEIV